MHRVLTPNFSLPPISVAPSGCGQSPESLHAAREDLRLLVVDGTTLSAEERLHLWPRDSEVRDWYVQAAQQGVTLVVVRTKETIELYTTQHDRQLACAAPLLALAQRSQLRPELSRVRVTPYRGIEVARHLHTHTAGIGTTRGKAKVTLSRIEAAVQLADRAGSLNATLDSLFRSAVQVGNRVFNEALTGITKPSESMRELADIGAVRIVEEELLNWKSEQTRLFRSLSLSEQAVRSCVTAPRESHHSAYPEDDEAPSGIRIRVAADLSSIPLPLVAIGQSRERR
jgi:hypothetical protein